MKIQKNILIISNILEKYSTDLGSDFILYKNHVLRLLNYYHILAKVDEIPQQVLIAAAFHDLGIWTAKTFDYLEPSVQLVREYLEFKNQNNFALEVETIILQHHKIREYSGNFKSTVELFRKADLIDVSLGCIKFGIPKTFIHEIKSAFPNAGFHRKLTFLMARQFVRTPLHPLPMVRW